MSRFVLDILDGNNDLVGQGPITNVLSANEETALDEIGRISASVPANDPRVVELLATGVRCRIRTSEGPRAVGLIRNLRRAYTDRPTLSLSGPDILAELSSLNSGWFVNYRNVDINSVVLPSVVAGTAWSLGSVDGSLGNYQAVHDGHTRLQIVQGVRNIVQRHFRLGTADRTLDFGAFGADSGIILLRVDAHRVAQEDNTTASIVADLEEIQDIAPVVNWISAWGAGRDDGFIRQKVTLQDVPVSDARAANIRVRAGLLGAATTQTSGSAGQVVNVVSSAGFVVGMQIFIGNAADYSDPRQVNVNVVDVPNSTQIVISENVSVTTVGTDVIGWPQYYIYNATAYAGEAREATIVFPEIDIPNRQDPIAASDWENAARMVYDRAAAYLNWHADPQTVYRVQTLGVPEALRVGDRVRLLYRGIIRQNGVAVNYADINDLFWVIRLTRTWQGSGARSATLELSNIDRQPVTDSRMVAGMLGSQGAVERRV